MAADHPATHSTTPFCSFFFYESLYAMLFDKFEVFYHAHVVVGAIPFIEVFQSAAGKILALVAEPHKSFPQEITLLLHEGAVFTAWPAAGAVPFCKTLLVQVIFHCQVADTNTAVHPAGSNEFFFHSYYQPEVSIGSEISTTYAL